MLQFRRFPSFYFYLGLLLSTFFLLSCGSDKGSKNPTVSPEAAPVESSETTELLETVEKNPDQGKKDLVFDASQANFSTKRIFALKILWLRGPVTGYDNDVELTFALADLTKVEQVELIRFTSWMEIHGHGGDDRKVIIERDRQYPHVFHIRNFSPFMAGPWSLRITAVVNGVEDNIDIPFKI